MAPGYRLYRGLQFGQRELLRHKLKNDGPVFELGAQPRDGCCQDSPVVKAHWLAQDWQWRTRESPLAPVARSLLNQSRFVEELITIEDFLLVPWAAAGTKA